MAEVPAALNRECIVGCAISTESHKNNPQLHTATLQRAHSIFLCIACVRVIFHKLWSASLMGPPFQDAAVMLKVTSTRLAEFKLNVARHLLPNKDCKWLELATTITHEM